MTTALIVALLHCLTFRSPVQMEYDGDYLVRHVYEAAGVEGVTVVWMESTFRPEAVRREPSGTSWGLWQLYDLYHDQHRDDIGEHIKAGAEYLEKCKRWAGGDFARAVAYYNGGWNPGAYSVRWGAKVQRKYDSLAMWLWRHLR